jgi:dTDP-3-amino-3,4,6-trideoxy-alpha-D-glucose transaminase
MIPQNDFKRLWAETGPDVLRAVEAVGAGGWYILGERVAAFERDLAPLFGTAHAIGVASGLDAIELSLRALGCGPGDFVLTSPISAFATPLAILKTGAIPVFADCDAGGLIDFDDCRRILSARSDIRYFVPVHLFGHCVDLEELRQLRDRFGLAIVEDCAQSIGASSKGVQSGSVGEAAATSFYPTKNLGALGDGGSALTSSADLDQKLRQLRDYGQTSKYRHDICGYNSRLDELHAAILETAFLPRLVKWTEARRSAARAYIENIRNCAIRIPAAPAASQSVWHLFPVLIDAARKREAIEYFKTTGVAVGEHYPLALIEQEAMKPYLKKSGGSPCEQAKAFCHSEISLPVHPYLTESEIQKVIDVANGWR